MDRQTATQRGAAKGITISDGGLPRAVMSAHKDRHLETRRKLREQGVHGDMRRQDERIAGRRGGSAVREGFTTAMDLARRGMTLAEALGLAVQSVTRTYELAYQHVQQVKPGA